MENDKEYKYLDLEKEVVIFDGERLTIAMKPLPSLNAIQPSPGGEPG